MLDKETQDYIEYVGLMLEPVGMGKTMGRILGWLLICAPPHQTLDNLCDALKMGKSTISTTVSIMHQFGMIEKVSLRGDRKHYYRLQDTFWLDSVEDGLQKIVAFNEVAKRGLRLLQDQPAPQRKRLESMNKLYTFLEEEFPSIIRNWRAIQKSENEKED